MNKWIGDYLTAQKAALDSIPVDAVAALIERLRVAVGEARQFFVADNGGSASNASHFATDLGKGSSDKLGRRFRVLSLNDDVSWIVEWAKQNGLHTVSLVGGRRSRLADIADETLVVDSPTMAAWKMPRWVSATCSALRSWKTLNSRSNR